MSYFILFLNIIYREREASQLSLQLARQLADGEDECGEQEGDAWECQSSALNYVLSAQQLSV